MSRWSYFFMSKTTHDSIYQILNDESDDERDHLTEQWTDHKLRELNFVGIVGALLANVLTSTNSWPDVLQDNRPTPWPVRACWFSGIILSLASVLTALSQSIRLHRLSASKDGKIKIRRLLSQRTRNRRGERLPQRTQVVIWQLAVVWLVLAVVAMVLGMLILVWAAGSGGDGWHGQLQLAVTFTTIAGVIIVVFVWEQSILFSRNKVDDENAEGRLSM